MAGKEEGGWESYVVVHNIAKRHNVGTLTRSATALGVTEMILVGRRDFNSFGSHGSTSHLRIRHLNSLSLARTYLKRRRGGRRESYVVVHNIAKRHNVGTLAQSATALGVREMILVGRRDFNSFGNQGSTTHLRFRHFHSLSHARTYLKEKDCDICGVEITDDAVAVNEHPFKRNTAFLLGNEGTGLSVKECEICDFFVYIPQYGCGTASLNVTVAASIVLHHFGVWAGFSERIRDGNKYIVAERPDKRNYCQETADSIAGERKLKRDADGFFDENGKDDSPSNLLDAMFTE